MKHHLYFLTHELERINDDYAMTNMLWHFPERKQLLIDNILLASVQQQDTAQSTPEAFSKLKEIYTFINARPWMSHVWHLHDTHFHTTFKQLIACPYTCISEIAEISQKLTEDINRS